MTSAGCVGATFQLSAWFGMAPSVAKIWRTRSSGRVEAKRPHISHDATAAFLVIVARTWPGMAVARAIRMMMVAPPPVAAAQRYGESANDG